MSPSACDAPLAFHAITVVAVGCNPDQGGDLFVPKGAKFGQHGESGDREHRPDAFEGLHQCCAFLKGWVVVNECVPWLFKRVDFFAQQREVSLHRIHPRLTGLGETTLFGSAIFDELPSTASATISARFARDLGRIEFVGSCVVQPGRACGHRRCRSWLGLHKPVQNHGLVLG